MPAKIAIIGGTGVGSKLEKLPGENIQIDTEYGMIPGRISKHDNGEIVALYRHAKGHKLPPHKVNYLGLAQACQLLNVTGCISSAAVGSLRRDWESGTIAVCTDFLDFTFRNITRFEDKVVHTDFTHPFHIHLNQTILKAASIQGIVLNNEAIYVGTNGPRYETPAEVRMFRQLGGDVVGMTIPSEAIAFKEIGVPYSCIAMVTNLGTGLSRSDLSHAEVVKAMDNMGDSVLKISKECLNLIKNEMS